MKTPIQSLVQFLLILFISTNTFAQSWTTTKTVSRTYCTPNTVDLNGDNVEDIVIGSIWEVMMIQKGFVTAYDGQTGDIIWDTEVRHEIYTMPRFMDITGDGVMDVFVGGRHAQYMAIDGSDGSIIWEFWENNNGGWWTAGWGNFYIGQFIDDVDGDGVKDILNINGGGGATDAFSDRIPGKLVIFSGLDGTLLNSAPVPGNKESYTSPLVLEENGQINIFYGTGGETLGGAYYKVPLDDLLNNDISNSTVIAQSSNKGFINPLSFVDMNNDQVLDYVIPFTSGKIAVIDGSNLEELWSYAIAGTEVYNSPTIANFGGDATPDILAIYNEGNWPQYSNYKIIIIDGGNQNILYENNECYEQFGSASALNFNGAGVDEPIMMLNTATSNNTLVNTRLSLIELDDSGGANITGLTPLLDQGISQYNSVLIRDIDGDGQLDIIYPNSSRTGSGPTTAYLDFSVSRFELFVGSDYIPWAGYLGTNLDGIYYPNPTISTDAPNELDSKIYVYPIPANDILNIEISSEFDLEYISISDVLGRTIELDKNVTQVNVSDLSKGVYFLNFRTINYQLTKKIVIE